MQSGFKYRFSVFRQGEGEDNGIISPLFFNEKTIKTMNNTDRQTDIKQTFTTLKNESYELADKWKNMGYDVQIKIASPYGEQLNINYKQY